MTPDSETPELDRVPGARTNVPGVPERRRGAGEQGDDLIERASRVMPQVVLESARLLRMLA